MHDDFDHEEMPGLPKRPPKGEDILWQGRPDAWALAKSALALPWVAGYFGVLSAWRFISVVDLMPFYQALAATIPVVVLGIISCALLWLVAFIQARATVYTLTSKRVVMRVGAALTLTLNLPYSKIASADLDLRKDGSGSIALSLLGDTRLGYLVLWPHVRPWQFRTAPSLRCIPDAQTVAQILSDAAETEVNAPRVGPTIQAMPAE